MNKKIVLAFSGGLDTSFCIPYLLDQDYEVHTLFVNTGGTPEKEERAITKRAKELGAKKHININVEKSLWSEILIPLIQSGALYQNKYPALCSDRYLIVKESIKLCQKLNTKDIAHGCTGMGNDQIRFDLSIRAHGDYNIITPIREIQNITKNVRGYEEDYLKAKGFKVSSMHKKYSVNENLMGATISGSEIDVWDEPSDESFVLCKLPHQYPKKTKSLKIKFSKGKVLSLNDKRVQGADLLRSLNSLGGSFGIGRTVFSSDTIIGLKGRFVFEAPGITILMAAHRALEESVLTDKQNAVKTEVGQEWVNLVYKGFYFEPLRENLEAFLTDSQKTVSGEVTLKLSPGKVDAVAVKSKNILMSPEGTYAQSATWSEAESKGFIKLIGQSTSTWSSIHKKK
ncbi:MAG: argininosuccinate synthase [Gammaproteobacteria bacterium]|jgi:argininosuccinate synthase|nr:argininosuccinate synthase [Gammaproteobacteria bacterium]